MSGKGKSVFAERQHGGMYYPIGDKPLKAEYLTNDRRSLNIGVTMSVTIDSQGGVSVRRHSRRFVTADLSFIPKQVIEGFEAVVAMVKDLAAKDAKAKELRLEVVELRQSIHRAEVHLRHDLWDLFPQYVDQAEYPCLVQVDENTVCLADHFEKRIAVVDGENVISLLERQHRIRDNVHLVSEKTHEADTLEREVRVKPELIRVEQDEAQENLGKAIKEGNSELWDQLQRHEAVIRINNAGKLAILVRRVTTNDIEGLDTLSRVTLIELVEHSGLDLPDTLREELGLPSGSSDGKSHDTSVKVDLSCGIGVD